MKMIRILSVAFLALFAFGAIAATASAETPTFLLALWLQNSEPVAENLGVESTALELELVNLDGAGVGITARMLCSGILVGTVGPESKDEITELLNLALESISLTPLVGLALACTGDENCTNPKVWADELPWKTEVELMVETAGTFFVDLLINGGYYAECGSVFGPIAELCNAATTAIQLTNETNGTVDAVFSDPFQELAGLKLGNCEGHLETDEVNGLGIISLNNKNALSVSSE
jgi:hypothetical protein